MSNETNIIFCGRPNYTGPKMGIFGLLHHGVLVEYSHDVTERVAYVMQYKPKHEIAIRLYNMIYLGGCQAAMDYGAKRAALHADYNAKRIALDILNAGYWTKRNAFYADYKAKCAPLDAEVLTYIRSHIPDCAWNGETLVFDGEASQ